MPSLPLRLSALFLALGLSACDDAPRFTKAEPGEARSGGSDDRAQDRSECVFLAFGQPAAVAACGLQRRQQLFPQSLGDRPVDHHCP
jgi:hypothetical protein